MTIRLIALDWGTSRLRACLIGPSGEVLETRAFDDGIASVPAGGFPARFARATGSWLELFPDANVMLAGMVGSRNGWIEIPYAAAPAGLDSLAAATRPVEIATGRSALIVPGISCDNGMFDVLRGEETLAFGTGVQDGLICLPGTHSKWVEMKDGRIQRFASFMTGEVYGLLRHQSLLARLATDPVAGDHELGLSRGLGVAHRPAGLLNALFSARSEVLAGRLPEGAVGSYLSAMLVGTEVTGATALFGKVRHVTLVAEGPVLASYEAALSEAGLRISVVAPEVAFVAGIRAVADAVRLAGMWT